MLLVVVVTGFSFGQSSPSGAGKTGDGGSKSLEAAKPAEPAEKALESLIAQALRNNPDILAAEAKLREAEAELRRAKVVLALKIAEQRVAVENQRKIVDAEQEEYQIYDKLLKSGQGSHGDMLRAQQKLLLAKAQLAQAEAALNTTIGALPKGVTVNTGGSAGGPPVGGVPGGGLLGGPTGGISNTLGISGISGVAGNIGGGISGIGGIGGISGIGGGIAGGGIMGFGGGVGGNLGVLGGGFGPSMPPPSMPQPSMADKLRVALDATIKLTPVKDKPLAEVLNSLRTHAKSVPFLVHLGEKAEEPVSLSLEGEVQLGAAFQALEDVVPGLKAYVREYGILVTLDEQQPEAAMPLVEFWRKKAPAEKGK
jgi:hypothetical protein